MVLKKASPLPFYPSSTSSPPSLPAATSPLHLPPRCSTLKTSVSSSYSSSHRQISPAGTPARPSPHCHHRAVGGNLINQLLCKLPSKISQAVSFDAGSSGSRVQVFCFDHNIQLLTIGKYLKLFLQVKPGPSAYAKDPRSVVESLTGLLDKAESAVSKELLHSRPRCSYS